MAKSIVLKDVQSPERLLDETALFLHRVVTDLPPAKQKMLERLHGGNEVLRGRKVLVVDDDARNIFALTSLLENHEMEVISATNGRQAIDLIQSTPDLSMVLMDIMMPDMDGYETMREIRSDAAVPHPADPGADRQGDEGRPREVPRRRRQRLHRQAGEHRPAAVADAGLAVPMNAAPTSMIGRRPRTPMSGRRRHRVRTAPSGAVLSTITDAPINILIVDDEPKNLTVLETVLDSPGYRLVRAESADQALLALVAEEFALLILDVRMPGMTGFELAQIIKGRKKTARMPIIFLTAYYNEDQHVLEGYGSGAVDYLHKPVNAAGAALQGRGVRRAASQEPRGGDRRTARCSPR